MELNEIVEKAPGFRKQPDYAIDIEQADHEIVATIQGQTIAKSDKALVLRESSHLPVVYFPREDVNMDIAIPSEKDTFCPFKGHASYFGFAGEANVAWSYEEPYQEMLAIKNYVAFYRDRLDHPLMP
ncbi:MAG: DUF427 domain-containing protein [Proteobacteria bacterium]|nr:DUF427 domain-containing protein [Pseudomonadota bacterium]